MDKSGNNRYELLFMDDEPALIKPVMEIEKKIKVPPAPVLKKTQLPTVKKTGILIEKENRSNSLNNKNEVEKSTSVKQKQRVRIAEGSNKNSQSTATRVSNANNSYLDKEQRRNIQNIKDGNFGEYNYGRQNRQAKERDNRIQIRNRNNETVRGGKREFDRQSGSDKTGVKAVDKRDGAGAHNWGSVKQEIEDINNSSNIGVDSKLSDKEESSYEQQAEETVVLEEEEAKVMTLDEWKAMRGQRNKPQFNLRKAGEGEDVTQWKKMVVLNKKKNAESEEEYEYDPSLYPQRVGRLQRIVDIQFNFNDGRRGGGSFKRNRGRGPRPFNEMNRFDNRRDNAYDDNPRIKKNITGNFSEGQKSIKVDDEAQFPLLC